MIELCNDCRFDSVSLTNHPCLQCRCVGYGSVSYWEPGPLSNKKSRNKEDKMEWRQDVADAIDASIKKWFDIVESGEYEDDVACELCKVCMRNKSCNKCPLRHYYHGCNEHHPDSMWRKVTGAQDHSPEFKYFAKQLLAGLEYTAEKYAELKPKQAVWGLKGDDCSHRLRFVKDGNSVVVKDQLGYHIIRFHTDGSATACSGLDKCEDIKFKVCDGRLEFN